MISQIFIFCVALAMVIKGATLATRYAIQLAENFHLSRYTIGFIVIAVISILPETLIGINASLNGIPEFGLGMILGSNVADLTLIFALIIFLARKNLRVEQHIIKNHALYPFILLFPLILGLDGYFSRTEGIALIFVGCLFYYLAIRDEGARAVPEKLRTRNYKSILPLLGSLALLLLGSHFVVASSESLALSWGISPMLIGMLVVSLGTTMPEFFFSLAAVKSNDDSLAIGDILGTVLADATIVIGIFATIAPFAFPRSMIYVSAVCMVAAAFILFSFMRSGHTITRREGFVLFVFWLTFVFISISLEA